MIRIYDMKCPLVVHTSQVGDPDGIMPTRYTIGKVLVLNSTARYNDRKFAELIPTDSFQTNHIDS